LSYSSKHILIKDPKEWYNLIANDYGNFHKHLNSFDNNNFLNFIPRDTEKLNIIDLWAWDGRIYDILKNYKFKKYIACDIAEKLLKKHPWKNVEKIICDLEKTLPFQDNYFDLAISFFVLEHIENLQNFFEESYRILNNNWKLIIWYFLQRREFLREHKDDNFKIKLFNHKIQNLETLIKSIFDWIIIVPIKEKNILIWFIIICEKR
jgi:SAM-dependent methyltransferase